MTRPLSTDPAQRLAGRRLYLCTPDRPDLEQFVARAIRGGVDVVQLRDKTLEARPLMARARRCQAVCRDHDVPFIVNDRPDLALAVEADGVHVGQDDVPASLARRLLGPDAIVGLSTHRREELEQAISEPVDYISAGPVVATPTKPGRPGTGLGYLAQATAQAAAWPGQSSPMPVFVTGGVSPSSVPELVAAGATRFVVVRYLTEADDPQAAARRLRRAIDALLDPPGRGGSTS